MSYRRGISERYASVFTSEGDESEVGNKWGWYGVIYNLADQNLLKMDAVTLIYIEEELTFLAYEKDVGMSDKINIDANSRRYK